MSMTRDLSSIGMNYSKWQDAVEAAIASEKLDVIGEVRGGQLIQYVDPSGAKLFILAAEPFTTFSGFAADTVHDAHVTMVNDVLALCDVVDDAGYHVATVTANLAQGPLLVDEPTQQWQRVALTALAVDADIVSEVAEPESSSFVSHGAEIVQSGAATAPDASATITAVLSDVSVRTNELTGSKFVHGRITAPFACDVCLPLADATNVPTDGAVVSGTFVLAAEIQAPAGCGGDGGCGCGSGGCGGH